MLWAGFFFWRTPHSDGMSLRFFVPISKKREWKRSLRWEFDPHPLHSTRHSLHCQHFEPAVCLLQAVRAVRWRHAALTRQLRCKGLNRLQCRCRCYGERKTSLNDLINQYSLGESRSILHCSYATEMKEEKVIDERIGRTRNMEPSFVWRDFENTTTAVIQTNQKEEELKSRSIV